MDFKTEYDNPSNVVISQSSGHVYIYVTDESGNRREYVVTGGISSDIHGTVRTHCSIEIWDPEPYVVNGK